MNALLPKASLSFLFAAAMLLVVGLIVFGIVSRIDTLVAQARAEAIESRDAHWTAEIERTNAEANSRIAAQVRAALDLETKANARIRAIEDQLSSLENENAALPDGDRCGLGRDRVRLLPR